MAGTITHKDINLLSQKSTIAGTEKIPVSDTEYVTPTQIAGLASSGGISDVTVDGTSVVSSGVAVIPAIPAAQVQSDWNASTGMGVILNKPTIPTVPTISTSISTDANDDTKTASPKAIKTYVDTMCGDIETLLAAL